MTTTAPTPMPRVRIGDRIIVPFGAAYLPAEVIELRRGRIRVSIPVEDTDETITTSYAPEEIRPA